MKFIKFFKDSMIDFTQILQKEYLSKFEFVIFEREMIFSEVWYLIVLYNPYLHTIIVGRGQKYYELRHFYKDIVELKNVFEIVTSKA